MSRIKIRNPGQTQPEPDRESFYASESALHSYGTILEIDGREVPMVRSIMVRMDVDDLVRCKVEVLASGLDIEVGADVAIQPVVIEPGILTIDKSDDGKTQRIRFERAAVEVDTMYLKRILDPQ